MVLQYNQPAGMWGSDRDLVISRNDAILRLLAVDEDQQQLALIRSGLVDDAVEVYTTSCPQEGLDFVRAMRPQVVLVDLTTPRLDDPDMMTRILEIDPGIDVVLMTRQYDVESAVAAIKKGASDCLTKPVSLEKLRCKLKEFTSHARLRQRSLQIEDELREAYQFEGIIGRSPLMLDLFSGIRHVAPHFRTALLLGETGTGKELAAKALHRLSPVSSGPFVTFNCSAIVETLAENELFGHEKGSFTGATVDKAGLFEHANGGTLMLDEIGELSLAIQAKLLRVLQDQRIQRIGSPKTHKVDVRVIAATHRNLRAMVAEKTFRNDLYYRLSMIEIEIPPLNQRKEDLSLLQRHFLRSFAKQYGKPIRGLTRRAQALLGRYPWPGNIRELENVLGHACLIAEGDVIDIHDFPQYMRKYGEASTPEIANHDVCTLEENQRRYVHEVVKRVGNKMQAAHMLGISRTTLYRCLKGKPMKQEQKVHGTQ